MKESFVTTELFFKDVFFPVLLLPDDNNRSSVIVITHVCLWEILQTGTRTWEQVFR